MSHPSSSVWDWECYSGVTGVVALVVDITVTTTYRALSAVMVYVPKSCEDDQNDVHEALSTVPRAL